jgi:hypothetical protein
MANYLFSVLFVVCSVCGTGSEWDESRRRLQLVADTHLRFVVSSLVDAEAVPAHWVDLLLSFAGRCVSQLSPSVRLGDAMDIRSYVKVKTVGGGSVSECRVVDGVVFRKAVPHKRVKPVLSRPTLLLLKCGLEYERVSHKLSDVRTLLTAEKEYIELQVRKILALAPDIVVLEKTACRLAQDLLHAAHILVLQNVKAALIDRLARACEAPILPSTDFIDASRKQVLCGSCGVFRVVTHADCDTPLLHALERWGSTASAAAAGLRESVSPPGSGSGSASGAAPPPTRPSASATTIQWSPPPATDSSLPSLHRLPSASTSATSAAAAPAALQPPPATHRSQSRYAHARSASAAATASTSPAPPQPSALQLADEALLLKLAKRAERTQLRRQQRATSSSTSTSTKRSAVSSSSSLSSSSAPYKFRFNPQLTCFDDLSAAQRPPPLPAFVSGARASVAPQPVVHSGAGPSASSALSPPRPSVLRPNAAANAAANNNKARLNSSSSSSSANGGSAVSGAGAARGSAVSGSGAAANGSAVNEESKRFDTPKATDGKANGRSHACLGFVCAASNSEFV